VTREAFPMLACRDLLGTRAFYAAVFGAEQEYQYPEEGDPVFVSLRVGASTIALSDGNGETAYGEIALPSTGHPVDLCLYVEDLDATLGAGPRHGATLIAPAADMPWGERVGWLRDPEGIMLLVIQAE
jgi:lactoylglutathione lyase